MLIGLPANHNHFVLPAISLLYADFSPRLATPLQGEECKAGKSPNVLQVTIPGWDFLNIIGRDFHSAEPGRVINPPLRDAYVNIKITAVHSGNNPMDASVTRQAVVGWTREREGGVDLDG